MLYKTIKTASKITDSCIISFSCGKDSIVTLDLCHKHFKNIYVYFMYIVDGLEVNEGILKWYEDKYQIEIKRIPHWDLSNMFRTGAYRLADDNVKQIKNNDIYDYVRDSSGFEWISAGERIADSMHRRGIIKSSGSIDAKRRRFYPVSEWKKEHILKYIKRERLKIPVGYEICGRQANQFDGKDLSFIKKYFPGDYEKIQSWFPFIDVAVKRYEHGQPK